MSPYIKTRIRNSLSHNNKLRKMFFNQKNDHFDDPEQQLLLNRTTIKF